jgi:hypothetical protein
MEWLRDSPRGDRLPIGCQHRFSFGKPTFDLADLPDGWTVKYRPHGHPDTAAFPTADQPPIILPDGRPLVMVFLQDPDGELVATWDERRWWTPEESNAWLLMLRVPDTYTVAAGLREQQMPRWWRRRKRK